jgi:hypothetical protein
MTSHGRPAQSIGAGSRDKDGDGMFLKRKSTLLNLRDGQVCATASHALAVRVRPRQERGALYRRLGES